MARQLPEFDELKALAESDPQRLEDLRRELIEDLIAEVDNEALQRRLRGLQFRIDIETERCKTPMSACLRISEMMHESLVQLRDSLTAPMQLQEAREQQPLAPVIEFKASPEHS